MQTQHRLQQHSMRNHGFTLVEILAAFVVFTLIFAAVLQLTTVSLRNVAKSTGYTEAAFWAESKLAEIKDRRTLEIGNESGRFDEHYRWKLDIREYDVEWPSTEVDGDLQNDTQTTNQPVEEKPPFIVMQLTLTVLWNGDKQQESFATLVSRLPENN